MTITKDLFLATLSIASVGWASAHALHGFNRMHVGAL